MFKRILKERIEEIKPSRRRKNKAGRGKEKNKFLFKTEEDAELLLKTEENHKFLTQTEEKHNFLSKTETQEEPIFIDKRKTKVSLYISKNLETELKSGVVL